MKEREFLSAGLRPALIARIILASLVILACTGAGCTAPASPAAAPATAIPPQPPLAAATSPAAGVTDAPHTPFGRIVVTNADAAELLLALGAEGQVVGVSETVKNHPLLGPRYAGAANIGSWSAPDIETILSLHPDAVISYSSYTPKNIGLITSAGVTLLLIDCYKIDTLASDTLLLGNLTGRNDEAARYLAFLDEYESLVRSRTANLSMDRAPRVYFESYSDYSALTMGSGGDQLIAMAGGSNIAGLLPATSPKVNAEWVYAENPDIIVKVAAAGKSDAELRGIRGNISGRTGIAGTNAVVNDRVYILSNSVTYGPRSVAGLVYLAKILHPQEFADIRPQSVLDDYAGRFVPGANLTPVFLPDLS